MNNYPDTTWAGDPDAPWNEPEQAEIIDPAEDAAAIRDLCVAQALYKAISAEVKTRDEFNLRGKVDGIMAERFAQAKQLGLAPKSFDLEIDGEKVGTYSISTTKEKPAETHVELEVENRMALLEWALPLGYYQVDMAAVEEHFARTGEVPPGCLAVPRSTPAVRGGRIEKTTLRIDPVKVADALGAQLGDVARNLLEGEQR